MDVLPIDRIILIIKEEKMSLRGFSTAIGKQASYITNIKAASGNFSVDVLNKIHEVFPKYSINWIVTGEGSMISKSKKSSQKGNNDSFLNDVDAVKKAILLYMEDTDIQSKLKAILQ